MATHKNKPKACSFKLLDKTNGQIVLDYTAPQIPTKLVMTGDHDTDEQSSKVYAEQKKEYINQLKPDHYEDFLPTSPESPAPHVVAVGEKYSHAIASSLWDLRVEIGNHIQAYSSWYNTDEIIKARVKVVDGADGFGDFRLVSSCLDRAPSDHGVTYDFTILEIFLKPNKVKDVGTTKSTGPILLGASWAEDSVNQPLPQRNSNQKAQQYIEPPDEEEHLEIDTKSYSESDTDVEAPEAPEGYVRAFRESNPESFKSNRPLFRASLNENDKYSTGQIVRYVELQRMSLCHELEIQLDIQTPSQQGCILFPEV